MPELRGRNRREYRERVRRLRSHTRRHRTPCWICGRPIDTELPAGDARSFTAVHVKQLKDGGSLLGALMPAHRDCNARRGNRGSAAVVLQPLRTSRRW